MNVEVHIERVILENIDLGPAERAKLRAALEHELATHILARGLSPGLAQGTARSALPVGDIVLERTTAGHVAERVGAAVGGALCPAVQSGGAS